VANNYHHWQPEEIEYLRGHYGVEPIESLQRRFNVTREAVRTAASKFKISRKKGKLWSEEEDDFLRQRYQGNPSELSRLMNRSVNSIHNRVHKLGLNIRRMSRHWAAEELDLIKRLGGYPISQIKKQLDNLCDRLNLSKRSRIAIAIKLREYNGTADPDRCVAIIKLAEAFKADKRTVKAWVESHKKELKPIYTENGFFVPETRLAKFISRYPGEIVQFKPDLVWLIDLIKGARNG